MSVPIVARPVAPSDPRWRESAEAAFDAGAPIADALRLTPVAGWMGLALVALAIASALCVALVAHIEVTARGPATLQTAQGAVVVLAEAAGLVTAVHVHSGERVAAGQALIAFDVTASRAALEESEKRLQFADNRAAQARARLDALAADRRAMLQRRAQLLEERIASHAKSVQRYEQRMQDFEALRERGFVSAHARDDAADRLDDAQRQRLALMEELARVRGELGDLAAQRETELLRLDGERAGAQGQRDAARTMLRQGVALAALAGVVESVVVRQGEAVQAGTVVARIVPDEPPDRVVGFIAERDRAFLAVGAAVRIDVRQLPAGEFGSLDGRVARIGADLAGTAEIRNVLGDSGVAAPTQGLYRVDIALLPSEKARRLRPYLRAGMLADVRFTLRERRVITLVIEPLRRWLQ
jgi:multidrug resistance efflux pump